MWLESSVTYPIELRTDKYNIIREVNEVDLQIIPLVRSPKEKVEPKTPMMLTNLTKTQGRIDRFPSLNAGRFDIINKDPKVGTKHKHVAQVQFKKQTDRKRMSFSKEHDKASQFYEPKKEITMPRLDICSPVY